VDSTADLRAAFDSDNGENVATAIFGLGGAASTIVVADTQQPQQAFALPQMSALEGDCSCSGDSCDFTACGTEGSFEISGSVTRSGDTFNVDLELTINFGGV